jgi:hypothetical protein
MTLALYAVLALAVTWPLGRHLATHVTLANIAALGDPWVVGWALAYESRALVGLPHGGIYHPAPHALYYGEAAIGALPLFAGPYLLTGNPVLGLNVVFLGGLVLTAWSLHTSVRRWTGSSLAGFLAGWTWLACPFGAWAWGPSAVNYVTLWYWPWIVRLSAATTWSLASAIVLGVLVFLQGLSTVYVAVGVLVPLVTLAAIRLARAESRRAGWHLALAAGIAVVGWGVVFAPYLVVRETEPDLAHQTLYPFFPRLPIPSGLFAAGEPSGIAPVGLAVIALGALVALRDPGRRGDAWGNAALWTVVGLLLALPPRVLVLGHAFVTPVGLAAAAGLPVHAVRDNGRRGLAALIGLCMLVGVAAAELVARIERARPGVRGRIAATAFTLLLAVGTFHGLLRPVARRASPVPTPGRYPLLDVHALRRLDSPIMTALQAPGGPVLELPTAPGLLVHADAMHRASVDGRPLLNGFDGYWPATFPRTMALACRLPDPDALATLRRETGLELVLVHLRARPMGEATGPYACPPRPLGAPAGSEQTWDDAPWEDAARGGRTDLVLVARDGDDLLFRTGP